MEGAIPIFILSLLSALLYRHLRLTKVSRLTLPPGPRSLPVIGNLLDIPLTRDYQTYTEWKKKYGDVIYLTALSRNIVILNSVKSATELLDQRGNIYSDRPYLPMIHEPKLMNAGWIFAARPLSNTWKRQRRLFTQYLNPKAITSIFAHRQTAAVKILLREFLENPEDHKRHLITVFANVVLDIAYGYEVGQNDPMAELASKAVEVLGEGFQPGFLVNAFPALRYLPSWLPSTSFKEIANLGNGLGQALLDRPFEWAKGKISEGKASPSFVSTALSEIKEGIVDARLEQDVKETAGTMFVAGIDTMTSALLGLILQLIMSPDVQQRAQAELDSVIGSPTASSFRLPTLNDHTALPYIEALCKEGLRWNPPAGTGLPHSNIQEDTYNEWYIPKGTILIANAWGMLRDENVYKEPYTFNPERFLNRPGHVPEPHPGINGLFGFGKRLV
ncbi:hypothetical protein M422DRAFT_162065 [Sphaerobolus stellatus SS14]|nr:hypothetical protein M422DRAFT_162065 [Sphaerobolus stellatus SS14]